MNPLADILQEHVYGKLDHHEVHELFKTQNTVIPNKVSQP